MILSEKIVMIEPRGFSFNDETRADNFFQTTATIRVPAETAMKEFHEFKIKLMKAGIEVTVFTPGEDLISPDSVFPNNWFSTTPAGQLILYPMMANNRRLERKKEIIDRLKKKYSNIIDLTHFEDNNLFLEGTGSLVIDHETKTAYASLSQRTSDEVVKEWSRQTGYNFHTFESFDSNDEIIYHTNVMMALGDGFAIACFDAIKDNKERETLREKLSADRELIIITKNQMHAFCGNCINLKNSNGEKYIVMSTHAYNEFTESQKNRLIRFGSIIYSGLSTIETLGGGSARCMIAELF